jgi:hypothetical protein
MVIAVSVPKFAIVGFIFTLILCNLAANGQQIDNDEDVITPEEQKALDKFRSVFGENLVRDYERRGITVLHYLRDKKFDVQEANKAILATIEWRKTNKINRLLSEKLFPELKPYEIKGFDKKGRPVGYINPTAWDVRKVLVAGKRTEFIRYATGFMESVHQNILEARNSTGKDIRQSTIIVDAGGYNLRQHACIACFPFYLDWLRIYMKYYPLDYRHLIFVNVPRIAHPIIQILKQAMDPYTRRAFKVYSSDREEWAREITKIIDASQLSVKYGGKNTS